MFKIILFNVNYLKKIYNFQFIYCELTNYIEAFLSCGLKSIELILVNSNVFRNEMNVGRRNFVISQWRTLPV